MYNSIVSKVFVDSKRAYFFLFRAGALLAKFVFLLFANANMESSDVVNFYLINYTVMFCVYLVNFEYSSYAIRRMYSNLAGIRELRQGYSEILSFVLTTSIAGCTLTFIIFIGDGYELAVISLLSFLVEYYTKEFERWLVFNDFQIKSAFSSFFRSAFWVLIVLIVGRYCSVSLLFVYLSYLSAGLFSILFCIFFLSKESSIRLSFKFCGPRHVISCCKLSGVIFTSLILIKFLFAFDKHIVQFFSEDPVAAAYVFYFSLAFLIVTFLESMLYAFDFPKMIKLGAKGGRSVELFFKTVLVKSVLLSLLLGLGVSILSYLLCFFLGKEEYLEYFYAQIFLVASIVSYAVYLVVRQYLYVKGRDLLIFSNSVILLVAFLLFFFIFYLLTEIVLLSVSGAMAVSSIFVLTLSLYRLKGVFFEG